MKINNKRFYKFLLTAVGLLLIIVLFISGIKALIHSNKVNASNNSGSKAAESPDTRVFLTGTSAGNITVDENQFYRVYYIQCKNKAHSLKYEDTSKTLNLTINKADVENIAIKSDKSAFMDKEVEKLDSDTQVILKFNKLFPDGNKINVKIDDDSVIVVKIARTKKNTKPLVIIDAGHGGKDAGSSNGTLIEKNITLKIVKYISDYINTKKNVNVILSRDDDTFHFVKDLERTACETPADLYVSVHINLFTGGTQYNGVQTHYDFLNEALGADSKKLASDIQKEVVKNDGWFNRGVINNSIKSKEERLYIRKIDMPSALIECGFLSNSDDRARLSSDAVLKNLAANISNGITNYLKEIGKLKHE